MSPASYLTAPPRDAAFILADVSSVCHASGGAGAYFLLVGAPPDRSRQPEADTEHRDAGDRVEHEVVAGDDDREHDERRVDHAGDPRPPHRRRNGHERRQ